MIGSARNGNQDLALSLSTKAKKMLRNARVAIFEAKYTKVLENLESECDTALQQIDDRMYAKEYEDDYDQILCYGISFFKKRCMVKKK